MNRIEEMIKVMCPEGVRRVKFSEVATYTRGVTYNKKQESTPDDTSSHKIFRANNITLESNLLNYDDIKHVSSDVRIKEEQWLKKGDILICAGSGSKEHVGKVAFIWNDMDYSFGGFMAVIRAKEYIDCRYLYHCFIGSSFKEYLNVALNSTTINNLNNSIISQYEIPLPPLSIQQEIVKILDSFTALQQNLEDELKLRQKQYEHYREKLLTFEDGEVEWKKLGDVTVHQKGKNKNHITENAYSITQSGLVPTREFFKEKTHVTSSDTKGYYLVYKNWFVYSPSRVDVGSISYLKEDGPVIVSPIDVVFSISDEKCSPKYLLNYLKSHNGKRDMLSYREGVEGTGRRSLPFSEIAKMQIPIPPLETQLQITQTLDHFESLISNLKTEIELRKKQYEYYREKLLTF